MKKYKLRMDLKKVVGEITLFRIECVTEFKDIKSGELGGWIEKEENLSQSGNAWVCGDAEVYGDAMVSGDARVYGNAWVSGDARVSGNAEVYGNAWVYGNAMVYGDAEVYGNARVSGNAEVYGDAWVSGDARVYGNANIFFFKMSGRFLTFCCDLELGISVTVGCQKAISLELFKKRIFEDGEYTEENLPKHRREYLKVIELVEEFMEPHKEEK